MLQHAYICKESEFSRRSWKLRKICNFPGEQNVRTSSSAVHWLKSKALEYFFRREKIAAFIKVLELVWMMCRHIVPRKQLANFSIFADYHKDRFFIHLLCFDYYRYSTSTLFAHFIYHCHDWKLLFFFRKKRILATTFVPKKNHLWFNTSALHQPFHFFTFDCCRIFYFSISRSFSFSSYFVCFICCFMVSRFHWISHTCRALKSIMLVCVCVCVNTTAFRMRSISIQAKSMNLFSRFFSVR